MIHIRTLLQTTAVIALVFGISPPDPHLSGEPSPVPRGATLLAADQSPSQQSQSLRQIEPPVPVTAPSGPAS